MMSAWCAFQPLLAIDDTVIGLAVAVIWVIGWILKLVSGQAQKGPPVANRPRPPVRPRDDKLQEEIDIFIQEVGPKKGVRRPPASSRPPVATPAQARPSPAKRPASAPLVPVAAPPARPAPRRVKPGQEIASRHIASGENMGAGVQQHLKQHMSERVAEEAATHLAHKVDQSVAEHLGQSGAPAGAPAPASQMSIAAASGTTRSTRLAELFRNPGSLSQAIVVSLVLSPPPALKHRNSPTRL